MTNINRNLAKEENYIEALAFGASLLVNCSNRDEAEEMLYEYTDILFRYAEEMEEDTTNILRIETGLLIAIDEDLPEEPWF